MLKFLLFCIICAAIYFMAVGFLHMFHAPGF